MQAERPWEIPAMLFSSLIKRWRWYSGPDRQGHRRRRRLPPRGLAQSRHGVPELEPLEDRTVPSTLTITSAADDGSAGTLRVVLGSAQSGDAIRFAHQLRGHTITLTQGQLVVNQNVDVEGPGADKLTISGNAAGRIFDIGSGATVTIAGLTLTGGMSSDGAAILNGGSLTLSHDVLSGNVAQGIAGGGLFGDGIGRGGGVENQAGATLDVSQSTFTGNQALGSPNGGNAFGGGIYNQTGTVTIDSSTFTANQALGAKGGSGGVPVNLHDGLSSTDLDGAGGGGIWNDGGSLTVTNSTLTNNLAVAGVGGNPNSGAVFNMLGNSIGGGVSSGAFFTTATPSLTIAGSTLTANQSSGLGAQGGAVAVILGDLTISNSAISSNLAEQALSLNAPVYGGGIYDDDLGSSYGGGPMPTLSITDTTIDGNVALNKNPSGGAFGGGIAAGSVNTTLTNSTLTGNQAIGGPGGGYTYFGHFYLPGGTGFGGGVSSFAGSLTVSGCTVSDNLAQGGPGDPAAVGGSSGFGGFSDGGGIDSEFQTLVLTNSTLSGNQSIGGPGTNGASGAGGSGGGLSTFYDSATVSGTTFARNLAQSAANSAGAVYSPESAGGAVAVSSTSLQLTDSTFTGNQAIGDTGGAGINGGAGGPGGVVSGGAISVTFLSSVTINNSSFDHNLAQAGNGGNGDTGGAGGAGGTASGGALAGTDSTITISNSSFASDVAQGGAGGAGGTGAEGGSGGNAQGGGLYNAIAFGNFFGAPALLTVTGSTITHEDAIGGDGGAGGNGGSGGTGAGGGLFNSPIGFFGAGQATLTISSCDVSHNLAAGGDGAGAGNGGNGEGGGIFNDAGGTATLDNSTMDQNQADGGDGQNGGNGFGGGIFVGTGASVSVTASSIDHNRADGGDGGSDGQGQGGGVYNLGTFTFDVATVIAHNKASTSNDDTFGV
jgi:hypothetical protein